MDEKRQIFTMRLLIVVFIAISVVLALVQYASNVTFIAQLMGVSWGALAGAFLAPFLYGLYWKRTTKAACMVNFAFSTAVMLANIFVPSSFPAILQSPINAGAFCMLAGLVHCSRRSACLRGRRSREHVRAGFRLLRPDGGCHGQGLHWRPDLNQRRNLP